MILSGTIACKRINIPDPVSSFTIPLDVSFVVIKNVGAKAMKFNFDDDSPSDFWTLGVNEQTPIMQVQGGRKFNTDGIDGATTIEVIYWG